jgi:hypothetical protein
VVTWEDLEKEQPEYAVKEATKAKKEAKEMAKDAKKLESKGKKWSMANCS